MYEIGEHGMGIFGGPREPFSFNMNAEIFIFGISGPIATALAVGYVRYLLKKETRTRQELETLNAQLEDIVAERTAALEARNRELAQVNAELQQLDQLKSDFVSLVSHELRAPLTVINGGVEVALQEADLPPRVQHALQTILGETNHLTHVVQTILDISRLEAGKLQVTCGPVAVRPLLENAIKGTLGASNRPLVWDVDSNLPPLWADEVYTEEVVRNLLRNADKYAPPGTPIHISAHQQRDTIQIAVTDHGPGIPQAELPHIFTRFHRAHTGENAPTGWGLGLYFSRKLTEAQNGSIQVETPVWQDAHAPGTRVTVTLPADITPEA
ncbi:MAG: hypothetical protein D6755_12705 [Anaerolineae bacterium]|nr:MAG: hypothetical protein D6755_12705 [Anaerolineae bacterium]